MGKANRERVQREMLQRAQQSEEIESFISKAESEGKNAMVIGVMTQEQFVTARMLFQLCMKQGYGKIKSMAFTQAMLSMTAQYPNAHPFDPRIMAMAKQTANTMEMVIEEIDRAGKFDEIYGKIVA